VKGCPPVNYQTMHLFRLPLSSFPAHFQVKLEESHSNIFSGSHH